MGKPRAFLEIRRSKNATRPIDERLGDSREFDLPMGETELRDQASRCMDCGIPFCHDGCPLGNLIPEWNELVMQGRMREASASLHATNNFPEITGRVCPAPCEGACVLNIDVVDPVTGRAAGAPVTIKSVERAIADEAISRGWIAPRPASRTSGRRVAIIGSGPAGLAAAQELARAGHAPTVFEKDDRIGGLLRYGIPDFKLEKSIVDRRVAQLRAEGVAFRTSVDVGVDVRGEELRRDFDAIVLCGGAMRPRDLDVPGRDARGVHFAMEFLTRQNRRVAGDVVGEGDAIRALGKRVVVLGGGDTGSDCVGTSHRQGAASVTSLELMPRPPETRSAENPWPEWPRIFRSSSSHDEGGTRAFATRTKALLTDDKGQLRALLVEDVALIGVGAHAIEGTDREIACELLLLAMGFVGPTADWAVAQLGVMLDAHGNVATNGFATRVAGIFSAGDMSRGQSLVVWAIADGRRAAAAVDRYLRNLDARPMSTAQ